MRAVVKRIHSPDAIDLRSYEPEVADDFSILIQFMVGPADADGEESFDVLVISPKRLAAKVKAEGPVGGRHLLIVDYFDVGQIEAWFSRSISTIHGEDWNTVANRIGRIGYWEFEDYVD